MKLIFKKDSLENQGDNDSQNYCLGEEAAESGHLSADRSGYPQSLASSGQLTSSYETLLKILDMGKI